MPSIKHVHRYVRNIVNRNYFSCSLKNCTHYIHKGLILGHDSICNKCNTVFQLTDGQLKNSRPVCLMCSKSYKSRVARELKEILEQQLELEL